MFRLVPSIFAEPYPYFAGEDLKCVSLHSEKCACQPTIVINPKQAGSLPSVESNTVPSIRTAGVVHIDGLRAVASWSTPLFYFTDKDSAFKCFDPSS